MGPSSFNNGVNFQDWSAEFGQSISRQDTLRECRDFTVR